MPLHTKLIVVGSWLLLLIGLVIYCLRTKGE